LNNKLESLNFDNLEDRYNNFQENSFLNQWWCFIEESQKHSSKY